MENKPKRRYLPLLLATGIPVLGLIFIFVFVDLEPDAVDASGQARYELHCANCHGKAGEGLRGLYPPLAKSDYLAQNQGNLACQIRHGLQGPIMVNGHPYNMAMPGNPNVSPKEITAIINYVNTSWGNDIPTVTQASVEKRLKYCAGG
ncbi:MAG: cytochrome c [Bacteroidota bacterium]